MTGDDENATNPSPVPPTSQAPHTISTIKLPILKKGEFQILLSQLEIHGACVSTEDAKQKFLSSTASSSSTQNVAFVSSDSTNSTNEVSTAYGVFTSSDHNSQKEGSLSYTDDLMYSFFANQSSGPQLDYEDLEQVDEFDLEEMDLKWQLNLTRPKLSASIAIIHNTLLECRSKGNQEGRRRDPRNTGYKARDNRRSPTKQDEHKAMVTIDEEGTNYVVIEGSYTDKVKVINAETEGISAAVETLNAATLIVSTVKQATTVKETSNLFMAGRSPKTTSPNLVGVDVLLCCCVPKMILATTLNRLERSIHQGIHKCYQSHEDLDLGYYKGGRGMEGSASESLDDSG
nr:hypothetical protein [Tanacetum cinerariifolium]